MRRQLLALAASIALAAAACGSTAPTAAPSIEPSPALTTNGTPVPSTAPVPADTVWLCKPGQTPDPCAGDLDATSIDATGKLTAQPAKPAADPPIDCFYVYPTVSRQKTVNANLHIDAEERGVAVAQAALFSQVCRVYAPMYPQLTLTAIADPAKINLDAALKAYGGVANAFDDYLANYNHGRGIVFIGHSQGAMMLTALLRFRVETDDVLLKQMVSALLMGGNVSVQTTDVGPAGDLRIIRACSSATQTGCVVAYSSFDRTPPADALFGRVATALNPLGRVTGNPAEIICVNPASPAGGTADLLPEFPVAGLSLFLGAAAPKLPNPTPFVAYPSLYSAHCVNSGGASWLQIDRIGGAADKRPAVKAAAPAWGLHTVDVNIALGNLVALVRSETAAFR